MALWIPQKGNLLTESNVAAVSTLNIGSTVTTGAASTTKGTVVQLIASTAFDAYWIEIMACDYALSATACEGMLDILIGSATEEILIPNLLMGHCSGPNLAAIPASNGKTWAFPLYIPAGSRIAAQVAGIRLSTAMRVAVSLHGGHGIPPFRVGSKVVTYPVSPTVPRGVAITVGNATEGGWTEIVAATTEDHFCVVPSLQPATDTTITQKTLQMEVGVGAATEEQIGGSYTWTTGTGEGMTGPWPAMPIFTDIPSGTRLVARVSGSAAGDTATDVALHCVS
jgi:hypothetical protein